MTDTDKRELKTLVKESTVEALRSSEGQDAIAGALTTEKAKDAILGVFVEAFHEVVVPVFEDQNRKIRKIAKAVGVAV